MKAYVYLSSFLAVYRTGSLRKAATSLQITQPAVGKHIHSLEDRLKQKLFVAKGRGVQPTPFAHQLAQSIAPHLDQLDTIVSLKDKKNIVSISLDFDMLGLLPKSFYEATADIELLFDNQASERVKKVEMDEFDFALTRNVYMSPHADHIPLFEEKHILVGAAELSSDSKLDAKTIENMKWVVSNEAMYFIERFWEQVFEQPFDIVPHIRVNNLLGIKHMLLQGAGVSVLPQRLCQAEINQGVLVDLRPSVRAPTYKMHLVYKEAKCKSPIYKKIKELLIKYLT